MGKLNQHPWGQSFCAQYSNKPRGPEQPVQTRNEDSRDETDDPSTEDRRRPGTVGSSVLATAERTSRQCQCPTCARLGMSAISSLLLSNPAGASRNFFLPTCQGATLMICAMVIEIGGHPSVSLPKTFLSLSERTSEVDRKAP